MVKEIVKAEVFNNDGDLIEVVVPQEYITKQCKALDIDTFEACQLYAFDQGIISDPEADALTQKAKDNKVNGTSVRSGQSKPRNYKRKEDEFRRYIIQSMAKWLCNESSKQMYPTLDDMGKVEVHAPAPIHYDSIKVENPERIVSFTVGAPFEGEYEFSLKKKRPPKK